MRKLAGAMVCLFVFLQLQSIGQTGSLRVKVKDEENLNLPGATVMLMPSKNNAVTNQQGEALFTGLAEGDYTLTIQYLGYQSASKKITVKGSITEVVESLKAGYKSEKEVIVMGDRLKGQARALSQQKANLNVSNIISADQIGRFPDANIGDAIKRIPGVAMQNDQGEARNIIIRGMGPELNAVNLNGERIPSAEGDNRRVQMDLIPADMIQTVEVNKTLTPDMDADAIGGSVNLVSRTPANGLRLSGTGAVGYNPIRNSYIGSASFIAGSRTANKAVGYLFSGSLQSNDYGSDNVESVWQKDANGKLYVADHDIRKYDVKRVRRSISGTFDFKLAPKSVIYVTGTYNWRDDLENRFRLRHRARGNASNLIYDAAGNITGYTGGEVLRQTKGGILNDRNEGRRLEDQRVRTLAVRGDHVFGKLRMDWNAQYARASEVRPNERYVSMGRRSITVSQDISDPTYPLLTSTTLLKDYTRLNELTEEFQDQFEEDFNAKLNFQLPASFVKGQKGSFKFGARIRSKTKVRNNSFYSYAPTTANRPFWANIDLLPMSDQTDAGYYAGSKFKAGPFVTSTFLGLLDLKNNTQFTESDVPAEYLAGNYDADETISAGFVQWNQDLTDKLKLVAGVRLENTSLNYTGNIVEDEKNFKGKSSFKNSYVNVLPSVNLRYAASDNMIWRLAATTGIARPKYYDLVPYFNVLLSDQELSTGNPDLKPIKSVNFDLMGEKYFKSIGIVSGGVFFKNLSNFYYTYRDESFTREKFAASFPTITNNPIVAGDQWQFTQRRNGSSVNVWGFEVAYQRQLDFLPGFLKGLGIYTNYTYTGSRSKGIYDGSGDLVRSNVTLPGTAPHMFNGSLSYETKKIVLRVSAHYTAAYVDDSDDAGYNADAFYDRYYDQQFFLDVNGSYAFTKNFRFFVEATNLTNQALRYYQGDKSRTAQIEFYGPRYNAGLKFDLVK